MKPAPVLIIVLLLSACGSSGSSHTLEVQVGAENALHGSSASCNEAGTRKGETVYACRIANVPEAYRYVGHFEDSTQARCFTYASGAVVDVTRQVNPSGDQKKPCG